MPPSTFSPVTAPAGGLFARLVRGRRWVRCAPDWPGFAGPGWEDWVMTDPATDRFHSKQGRSIGRRVFTRPDGATLSVYLKRHYVLPRWRGWLAVVLPGRGWSPGREEADHLRWADRHGLPVPRAVAAGEWVGPWGRLQGFLAVEELAGMLPLHEAVPLAYQTLTAGAFAAWKRALAGELARLARELHRRRAFHKDLYFCHFYIAQTDTAATPDSWHGRVVVIDLHRLGRHPVLWPWYQAKDLGQLLYSSAVAGVTARDRVRFWRLYRAGDWAPASRPAGWLRRLAVFKWRLYERQRARRAARRARTS